MMGTELREAKCETDTPSNAVIEAVAEAEGVEPHALDAPLYHNVDPDALDALIESSESSCVRFEYHGYEVRVDGDGGVTVVGSVD